jgi:hypothetical protein
MTFPWYGHLKAAALAYVEPCEGGADVEQRLAFLAVVRARSRQPWHAFCIARPE